MPKLTSAQQTRLLIKLDDAQRALDDILVHVKGSPREGADLETLHAAETTRQHLEHLRIQLVRAPMMRGAKSS